ncbi:MAG: hypothetical protein K9G33_07730 [Sneathiella sp.]|nr:hypothetical protein [Sneathiella sp.]
MFNQAQHKQAGQSIFMSSMKGLANVLAVVCTFFGTGPLYSRTVDWVVRFAASNYGPASADIASVLWGLICAVLIFFIARASISTALVMGALTIATRIF